MGEKEKKPGTAGDSGENIDHLVETPLFSRPKEWWRAKKVSMDFFGLEKLLGVDNRAFKAAVTQYKNLLQEIDVEYKNTIKSSDSPEATEEAKTQRDAALLDAKKDFVYHMPEDYRVWFKKRKVFNSWRTAPESWGFEESRYWGSRSGLTLREKRFLIGGFALGLILIAWLVYAIVTYHPPQVGQNKEFKVVRDSVVVNTDSIFQAREQIKAQNIITERNNKIVNQVNKNYYYSVSYDIQAEIRIMMSIYYQNQYGLKVPEWELAQEAVNSVAIVFGANNADAIVNRNKTGIPSGWKINHKMNVSWGDILMGIEKNNKIKGIKRK